MRVGGAPHEAEAVGSMKRPKLNVVAQTSHCSHFTGTMRDTNAGEYTDGSTSGERMTMESAYSDGVTRRSRSLLGNTRCPFAVPTQMKSAGSSGPPWVCSCKAMACVTLDTRLVT